ncbi:MAG: aspartate aminotransferase family protein [Thermoprotei archaeon ex4572_64]|nr:MAG: aspartate aminotransferase family protein [Thermoprotei archaeon ex4572_64]
MFEEIRFWEDTYIMRYYRRRNLIITRGFMQYVWDVNDVKYLDCNTCYGVAFLGHRNPKIVEVVKQQLDKILVTPLTFYNDARALFLEKFSKLLPAGFGKIILQNSGTEAVEVALKLARKVTRRSGFLAFVNSFHGRTFGSLSVTGNEKYRRAFEPLIPGVKFARFNITHDLDKLVTEDLAAVVVEPIQGEGGVNVATYDFMRELRKLTTERGVLLIIDEVQTGLGRTGKLWAFQHYNIEPDIFTVGKALAGGLPIGVTIIKREFGDVFEHGEHGSTFGGNPLVMAAAAATCELIISEDIPIKVRQVSQVLIKNLEDLTARLRTVLRVKGMGLMLGLELRKPAEYFVDRLIEEKILALHAGINTLRLLPPYCITNDDINYLISSLERVLK